MKRTIWRAVVWTTTLAGGGFVAQVGGCFANDGGNNALLGEIVGRQLTNIITDSVFFFLDNALVRLTA